MLNNIVVDGVTYNIACSCTRIARIVSSEVSGTLLDRTYYNDAVATYLDYQVKMAVQTGSEQEYASLYEVLTSPVSGHTFVFPYNQTVIEVTGRVNIIQDNYVKAEIRGNTTVETWRGIIFTVTSNEPYKVPEDMQ